MPAENEVFQQFAEQEMSTLGWLVERGSLLSNESASVPFVDDTSKFQQFVGKIGAFFNAMKVGNYKAKLLDPRPALAVLEVNPYSANRGKFVEVPPGFQGNWIAFEDRIERLLPAIEVVEAGLLSVISVLAQGLNEPSRLQAQSGLRVLNGKLKFVEMAELNDLQSFFKSNSKIQARLSDVVDRNADVKVAFDTANRIGTRLARVDFVKINVLINRVAELAIALNEKLGESEERVISGAVTSDLSELFYRLGTTATAASVVFDLMTQFADALEVSGKLLATPAA